MIDARRSPASRSASVLPNVSSSPQHQETAVDFLTVQLQQPAKPGWIRYAVFDRRFDVAEPLTGPTSDTVQLAHLDPVERARARVSALQCSHDRIPCMVASPPKLSREGEFCPSCDVFVQPGIIPLLESLAGSPELEDWIEVGLRIEEARARVATGPDPRYTCSP